MGIVSLLLWLDKNNVLVYYIFGNKGFTFPVWHISRNHLQRIFLCEGIVAEYIAVTIIASDCNLKAKAFSEGGSFYIVRFAFYGSANHFLLITP